jgi:hypothetical protein
LGEGADSIFCFDKKKAGRGAQPKEDKMKKLILLNSAYQNAGEVEIRRIMYFTIRKAVFLPRQQKATAFGRDVAPLGVS